MRPSDRYVTAYVLMIFFWVTHGWVTVCAQQGAVITGSVVDAVSGQPLHDAGVFVGYTRLGAITSETGAFEITQVPPGTYELVASSVGYTPQAIRVRVEEGVSLVATFRLQPAILEIDTMVVVGERSRQWERNLRRFTTLFIGSTPNARSTRILNPYVLRFQSRAGVLTAEAVEPLLIENEALGYRLTFVLAEFRAEGGNVSFWGHPYFEEMEARSERETVRWHENRERTYRGSFRHLLRALASDRLEEEGFIVRSVRRPGVAGSPLYLKANQIVASTSRSYEFTLSFPHSLHVTYIEDSSDDDRSFWRRLWRDAPPPTQMSWLTSTLSQMLLHERGYVFPVNAVTLSGVMGEQRIADKLPHDYVPETEGRHEVDEIDSVEWIAGTSISRPSPPYAWVQPLIEAKEWGELIRQTSAVLERDPADLEALYYRAVARREAGIIRTLFGGDQWAHSTDDFESILSEDSTFRDVLYQYAQLRRYEWRYIDALELGNAQVFEKPGSRLLRFALLDLYRHASLFGNHGVLSEWLDDHPSSFAAYAWAELLRRSGDLEMAASMHRRLAERLLKYPPIFPLQAVYLALARTYYALDDPQEAEFFVERAIADIKRTEDAAVVFNDFKYVFSPEELQQYQKLTHSDEYRDFFRSFWTRRDPTPAQDINVRLAEHYRRLQIAEQDYLYSGFRHWHNSPDKNGELTFPATYGLTDILNDKGAIFVRHGDPDDRILTLGGMEESPVESWRYDWPAMDFHFSRAGAHENGWRLAPFVGGTAFKNLEEWGVPYRAPPGLSAWGIEREMADSSRRHVMQGLSTDRHTWSDDIIPVEIDFLSAAFRGENGRTTMVYTYALPLGVFSRGADRGDTLDVEVGLALHDRRWMPAAQRTEMRYLGALPSDRRVVVIDQLQVDVLPDSYHVALHARSLSTSHLGGYRFDDEVPDLSGPGLNMSSILPAYRIAGEGVSGRFERGGLSIEVNPSRRFSVREPVSVYFEVYGLSADADGQTAYSIAYTLRQEERRGLFGRRQEGIALTLKMEGSGSDRDPVEYAQIDVSRIAPGEYVLEITVTDRYSATSVTRSRQITLTR